MRTGAQTDNPGPLEWALHGTDGRVGSPGSISHLCMLPRSPGSRGEGTWETPASLAKGSTQGKGPGGAVMTSASDLVLKGSASRAEGFGLGSAAEGFRWQSDVIRWVCEQILWLQREQMGERAGSGGA